MGANKEDASGWISDLEHAINDLPKEVDCISIDVSSDEENMESSGTTLLTNERRHAAAIGYRIQRIFE